MQLRLSGRHYVADYEFSQHPSVDIGKMNIVCRFCRAMKFRHEAPGMCCAGGKVRLPELRDPPEPLASLMIAESNEGKKFLRNIRRYNSCFQMTSFGATEIVRENYMPCFKIQGRVYHRLGSLMPVPDAEAQFLQIYFIGRDSEETDRRMRITSNVDRNVVAKLQRFLHRHNELVRLFKTVLPQMKNDDFKIIIRADKKPNGEHARIYNAPTVDEVSIVMVGEEFNRRDIVLSLRGGGLKRIAETHRSYDALQYPLLFWEGEDGYHFEIRMIDPQTGQETSKKVSSMNYYGYRLMIRENLNNHILRCRELFHQYVVDMYAKIESERLLFIRLNQRKLRSEEYVHLRDAIVSDGNVNTNDMGRMVIPPSTFIGGPRHMHEYAQDALTYVRHYGRPDLFITFTCIPDPEIDQGLFKIVTKFMIHGPCGVFNKKCPRMKDGRCSKRYPKNLHRDTITGNDGYPDYRRRSIDDGGQSFPSIVQGNWMTIDNRI